MNKTIKIVGLILFCSTSLLLHDQDVATRFDLDNRLQ